MTAEISILNKTAIVLAGDSAVTIGDGKKIYNTANKIFKLTEEGTVGVMVYNQANWMEIPLETIIKSYYKHNGNNTFRTLEEYTENFISFIKNNIYKYVKDEHQEEIVSSRTHEAINTIKFITDEIIEDKIQKSELSLEDFDKNSNSLIFNEMSNILDNLKTSIAKFSNTMDEFKDYPLSEFKQKYSKEIITILNGFSSFEKITLNKKFKDSFIEFIYKDIISGISDEENYSGIVIAGFGEDEIFPKIQDFKLAELFENRLRFEYGLNSEIDNNTVAIISPFAQRDMVDTFMQGIEPSLLNKLDEIIDNEFENLINQIIKRFKTTKSRINSLFEKAHDNIKKEIFQYRKTRHVDPIVTTVSYLNKEGLIELAESLVSITSLKRKTSSDLETVGGPVDIALITKGDGFKWIKNKTI